MIVGAYHAIYIKKQYDNVDFSGDFRPKVDNMDKYGREIAEELEKSIQKAIDSKGK